MSPESFHRFQFAFTITYHYLFPQLSMGLSLLLVILKTRELFFGDAQAGEAVAFWTPLFGINFAFGVVTGVPMEFQFGTNWSRFAQAAGGVIGSTLAMEGVFAFFLESACLGVLLYGRKRVSPFGHWLSSLGVCAGAWISGYFITATNSFMQHPVGYAQGAQGLVLQSLPAVLLNPWQCWAYPHVMLAATLTGCGVLGAVGAYYLLARRHEAQARLYLKLAATVGLCAAAALAVPTGDRMAHNVLEGQPGTFAGMEAQFKTEPGAPVALIGQPDVQRQRLDNPILVPHLLSVLTYQKWDAEVKGLDQLPQDQWPPNLPLLYYAYHIMAGLGTLLILLFALGAWGAWSGWLWRARWLQWAFMLALPLPYIANTFGWLTAETGRQPWIIWGVLHTADATSPQVSSGNVLFTLLGFMGLYALLSVLFLTLVTRELQRGPQAPEA
jgi:cytochrome d ubiquinol oxidase subunit I